MKVTVKTDIKGWKNVVSGLRKISGKDYKDIVDAETAEILLGIILPRSETNCSSNFTFL